jgi:hypothetical protein
MISFREIGYWGRLGNQMFQFASTIGIARKVGTDPKFPIENCFVNQQTGPFDPVLGRNLDVRCELLQCFEIPGEFFIPSRHIRTDFFYRENDFAFENRAFSVPEFSAVSGYFQTEKYFTHCQNEIKRIFTFHPPILKVAEDFLNSVKKETKQIVSVHVRRGDYVQSPNHHPPCDLEYYLRAFESMGNDSIFLVFSDDIEWCKSHFKGDNFMFSELPNHFEELCCMSLCDHHIIANSSFSWWGSWLNRSAEKKVIAPQRWFGPALIKDTKDIYCENWIKI